MKPVEKKYDYIPCEYEIFDNFNFDLTLNSYDYLLISCYFLVVYPLSVLGRILCLPFSMFIKKVKHEHIKGSSKLAAHKKHVFTSKFF